MKQNYFAGEGTFYKGNLHCHTTLSDGEFTPQEVVKYYKEKGYAFLALSDHNVFNRHDDLCSDGFITLPTTEYDISMVIARGEDKIWCKTHHVHGIENHANFDSIQNPFNEGERLTAMPYKGVQTVNEMRDLLKSRGTFCMYNHPSWSRTDMLDYGMLDGYTALEIFNYGCDVTDSTACSVAHWDALLERGVRIFGVATDDNHNRVEEGLLDDSFGGYIQVYAKELTRKAICEAILDGRFYASTGATINQIEQDGRTITVHCEEAVRINFLCGDAIGRGKAFISQGKPLTSATFEVGELATYVRIECINAKGQIAWSNPLYFN